MFLESFSCFYYGSTTRKCFCQLYWSSDNNSHMQRENHFLLFWFGWTDPLMKHSVCSVLSNTVGPAKSSFISSFIQNHPLLFFKYYTRFSQSQNINIGYVSIIPSFGLSCSKPSCSPETSSQHHYASVPVDQWIIFHKCEARKASENTPVDCKQPPPPVSSPTVSPNLNWCLNKEFPPVVSADRLAHVEHLWSRKIKAPNYLSKALLTLLWTINIALSTLKDITCYSFLKDKKTAIVVCVWG